MKGRAEKDWRASARPTRSCSRRAIFIAGGTVIPIQAHYKYFFEDIREGMYIGAMFGLGIQTMKTEDITVAGITVDGASDSNMGIGLAPVVGYVVNEQLDLGLRYQILMTSESNDGTVTAGTGSKASAYIGLRAAWNF
jgi:hypothetical protein